MGGWARPGVSLATSGLQQGIEIVTTEQANATLLAAGLSPAEADAVTDDYGDAQLDALKKAMLGVALLALLSFMFTRRLPSKSSSDSSTHGGTSQNS